MTTFKFNESDAWDAPMFQHGLVDLYDDTQGFIAFRLSDIVVVFEAIEGNVLTIELRHGATVLVDFATPGDTDNERYQAMADSRQALVEAMRPATS